jgi:hypothetical protein
MCCLFMIQSFSRRTIRNFTENTESGEPDGMYCTTIQTCFSATRDKILLHVYIQIEFAACNTQNWKWYVSLSCPCITVDAAHRIAETILEMYPAFRGTERVEMHCLRRGVSLGAWRRFREHGDLPKDDKHVVMYLLYAFKYVTFNTDSNTSRYFVLTLRQ